VTPEELATWHGVPDWNTYFDELVEWAQDKPVFFEGTRNWATPPPSDAIDDPMLEFLCINRDGRISKGRLINVSGQEGREAIEQLSEMTRKADEI